MKKKLTKRPLGKKVSEHRQSPSANPHPTDAHSVHRSRPPLLALAFAGMALTAYLTATKWFGSAPLACGAGSDCDLVQGSRWSTLLGMPVAFWGFLTYVVLFQTIWRMGRQRRSWKTAWVVAFIGAGISAYLTAISLFVLKATCIYCLTSFGLILAILLLLSLTRPDPLVGFQWRTWLPGTAGATLLVVASLQMHYSGLFDPAAGPEKPYLKALALHLQESGAKFYGAYWCPSCENQKALFEASAHRLPYVECTPDGRGGHRAFSCVTESIQRYPTWIINNQRYERTLNPERLARLSDFRWTGENGNRNPITQ